MSEESKDNTLIYFVILGEERIMKIEISSFIAQIRLGEAQSFQNMQVILLFGPRRRSGLLDFKGGIG